MQREVIAVQELRSYVERIERLESQKGAIGLDIKDLYEEAHSKGLDKKIMRRLIKERKQDRETLKHEQAILETYRDALEMPGFEQACKEAEEITAEKQHNVISIAGKTIEVLRKIKKDGGTFTATKRKDIKFAEGFEEMGFLTPVKDHVWALTEYGEAHIPESLV